MGMLTENVILKQLQKNQAALEQLVALQTETNALLARLAAPPAPAEQWAKPA